MLKRFMERPAEKKPGLRWPILAAMGFIILLGACLRLYHLGFKSLWLDEAVLYWISRGDWASIIAQNASQNSAPLTFALLLHAVSCWWGESESALRLISCVAGIASIPALYFLGRQF